MSGISSHVLDTSRGRPAVGVEVRLELRLAGDGWSPMGGAVTDHQGRVRDLLGGHSLVAGVHRVVFETGSYFLALGRESLYPRVVVEIEVGDPDQHYHVPLLLAPWGYTTYRGT